MVRTRKIEHSFEPLLVIIPHAAAMLDTTVKNIKIKLREGRLVGVKDGIRTFVTVESIKAYAASLPRAEFTPLPQKEPVA